MDPKGKKISANIKLALDTYCAHEGNKSQTLRALEASGHKIARQTLYRWVKEYRFDERLTNIDLKRQEIEAIARDATAEILLDLVEVKERYERFFAAKSDDKDPGTGPMFAYTGLVREILKLAGRLAPEAVGLADGGDDAINRAREAMEVEYGIKR